MIVVYVIMKLTEDILLSLPMLNDEEKGGFYADGEFETAVLSDFNEEADKIDAAAYPLRMH